MLFVRHHLLAFGDALLIAGSPAIILFVIFYWRRSPWRTLLAGRSLMYLAMAMSGVLLSNLAAVEFGADYPGRPLVRIVVYGTMSVMTWRLLFTLLRIQNAPAEERIEARGPMLDDDIADRGIAGTDLDWYRHRQDPDRWSTR
jgi:hypothetical protein